MKCIYCGSEDVIYRKFHHIWECQDCGESFDPDERERMTGKLMFSSAMRMTIRIQKTVQSLLTG